jgi:hypothetical protein
MFVKDDTTISELRELSPILAGYSKSMPYELPDRDWMVDFTDLVNERKNVLSGKQEVYVIPENYFKEFSEQVLDLIRKMEVEQEIDEISPLLSQLDRKLPYTRPAVSSINTEVIPQITTQSSKPGVIQLFSSRIVRFAVAACILTASLTFVIRFILNKETSAEQVQAPVILSEKEYDELLASVDDEIIVDYLQKEGIQLNQSDLETLVESEVLPEESDYFDLDLSEDFFRSIEQEMMNDSTINKQ